jgi:N-glycosidase YbiA
MIDEEPIKFYYEYQPYGYLSNFYPSPFTVNGLTYKTNEHFFQSKKFEGKEREQQIIDSSNPDEAFKLGQYQPRRADWEEVKEAYMYQGLKLKFGTH